MPSYTVASFISFSSFETESVIVTLISDNGGSPEVLQILIDYMTSALQDNLPSISLLTASVDRFGKFSITIVETFKIINFFMVKDGCSSENTLIPSYEGNNLLDFNITWPETNLGHYAVIECPCGGLNLSSTALIATRKCGGTYEDGAVWETAMVSACNFTDTTRELCDLASVSTSLCNLNKKVCHNVHNLFLEASRREGQRACN